jgi:hypothetical protein
MQDMQQCPLCRAKSEWIVRGDITSVTCPTCKQFRISEDARIRLVTMTDEHRLLLSHDAIHAQETNRVLEIRLAPIGSGRVFQLYRD